jgi:hypothetical protein
MIGRPLQIVIKPEFSHTTMPSANDRKLFEAPGLIINPVLFGIENQQTFLIRPLPVWISMTGGQVIKTGPGSGLFKLLVTSTVGRFVQEAGTGIPGRDDGPTGRCVQLVQYLVAVSDSHTNELLVVMDQIVGFHESANQAISQDALSRLALAHATHGKGNIGSLTCALLF